MAKIDRRTIMAGAAGLGMATALRAAPKFTGSSSFPAGFLWGAATSGHQIEGNNVNSDQ
jgi:beta-glucosidase